MAIWLAVKADFFRKTVDYYTGIWYNTDMLADRLRKIYEDSHADALFIGCDFLRRYLTGFYAADGYVILDRDGCKFFADPRYFEAAKKELEGTAVEVIEGSRPQALESLKGKKTVGIPYPFTDVTSFERLRKEFELVDCMPALREAMLFKSERELSLIQAACGIAEDGFLRLLPEIKEGMTENEVAALLEYNMRKGGASGVSFETIVAFGPNGSVPHHETGNTKLRFGDPVLIDFGCKVEGYCSDITRTFLFGDDKRHEEFKRIYGIVLTAHDMVRENLTAGMTGREGDAIARDYLTKSGLGKYFTHSLGHGIGLQIHEFPNLSPGSDQIIGNGMVFSDEPGVYIAGQLGIRIEDSMYMKDGKTHSFMHKTQKNLLVL